MGSGFSAIYPTDPTSPPTAKVFLEPHFHPKRSRCMRYRPHTNML